MGFEDNLRALLDERNLKLSVVCRDAGVNYSTLNTALHRGTDIMKMSVEIPIALAKYFNVSAYDLIGVSPPRCDDKIQDSLSESEQSHIEKYRRLNEPNRQAVNVTIDTMLMAQDAQKRGASTANNDETAAELHPDIREKAM